MGVKNEEKAVVWTARIAAFEASGQRRRDWCAAQGLNVNTFGYWRYRLREPAAATIQERPCTSPSRIASVRQGPATAAALVPLVVRPATVPTPSAAVIELEWPSGLRLRTTLGVSELGVLVRALSPC